MKFALDSYDMETSQNQGRPKMSQWSEHQQNCSIVVLPFSNNFAGPFIYVYLFISRTSRVYSSLILNLNTLDGDASVFPLRDIQ